MIEKENVLKFMEYIEKLAKVYDFNLPFGSYDIYAFAKDLLVWLEKQGEPQGKSALEAIKEEKVDNEPKFKVGDKIINNLRICTILEITNDKYIFTDGSYLFISNQDNWDLVPCKKEKFDPKTLQPFDKILMRDHSTEEWDIGYFSYIKYDLAGFDLSDCEEEGEFLVYTAGGANYWYAVPYNEETKHLVGTTDDAPEYYKYWDK